MNSSEDRPLSIVCVGDLAFHGEYERKLLNPSWSPLEAVAGHWRSADLRTGNLESPITQSPRASSSKQVLRGSGSAMRVLKSSGFDVVSLANNHQMDFGGQGIEDTKRRLVAERIQFVGAGKNYYTATRECILDTRSGRVGVLAWCDVEQISPLYATNEEPGVALFQMDHAVEQIKALRPKVDWLVVHLHWGLEFSQLPSPRQRECARRLAEAGVDLIIGHHPHVLHGAEVIGKTAVLYSLGNFVFASQLWEGKHPNGQRFAGRYRLHPLSRESGWVKVTLKRDCAPEVAFHATYLKRSLDIIPDNRPGRVQDWISLCNRLKAEKYDELFAQECQLATHRYRWSGEWRTIIGRIQLKLFSLGVLQGFRDA